MGKVKAYQWVKRHNDWGLPDRMLLVYKGLVGEHPVQIRKEMCLKCGELIDDHGCIGHDLFVVDRYQGELVCHGDWVFVEEDNTHFFVVSNPFFQATHPRTLVRKFPLSAGRLRASIKEYPDGSRAFYNSRGEITRIDSACNRIEREDQ